MSHILFLSRWFPDPPDNGSKLRIYNLLQGLAQEHEITLISFAPQEETAGTVHRLTSLCCAVHTVPWTPYRPHSLRARLGFLHPEPRSIVDTFSSRMARTISETLEKERYDLIIASQIDMAAYIPYFAGVPAIFEEAEVAVLYEQFSRAATLPVRLRYGLTWAKHRRFLRKRLGAFRACTVVSERERQLLALAAPEYEPVEVIPNCIDVGAYIPFHTLSRSNRLIFCGSFTYRANYEAMNWFAAEVFPRILEKVPDAELMITGDHDNLSLPAAHNVTLTGFVDDVRPLIAASAVSLAPLQTGGGTRLKVLEAMALGTPVVATGKGAEGLNAEDGVHLLLADNPQAFACAVVELLCDRRRRQQIGRAAFDLVAEQYDRETVLPRLLKLVEDAIQTELE